jgi:hypothetical protein
MNQSIRTSRQRYFSAHQGQIESSEWSTQATSRTQFEKHPRKILLGNLGRALIVVAVFVFLVVAAVVIRLVAFHPGFV